jgi:hypothetical protein
MSCRYDCLCLTRAKCLWGYSRILLPQSWVPVFRLGDISSSKCFPCKHDFWMKNWSEFHFGDCSGYVVTGMPLLLRMQLKESCNSRPTCKEIGCERKSSLLHSLTLTRVKTNASSNFASNHCPALKMVRTAGLSPKKNAIENQILSFASKTSR